MTHHPKHIELPNITFENSSEPPSPVSSASFESFDLQPTELCKTSQSGNQLSLPSPAKSFCSTASACRICHEGDTIGPLMSPCECKGTIALVHNYCLEKWLTTANSSHCEVCQYSFKVRKIPPPTPQVASWSLISAPEQPFCT
uniref:E3 ubiquitin-protein ligase MARCH2 n=1 Tax=Lygus hesperus TaxID=30085 RepID=A0A146M2Z1_LYGHE